MTPGKLSKGAPDESIVYAVSDCRLGKVIVARTGKGICAIALGDSEDELVAGLRNEFPRAAIAESDSVGEIVETVVAVLLFRPSDQVFANKLLHENSAKKSSGKYGHHLYNYQTRPAVHHFFDNENIHYLPKKR